MTEYHRLGSHDLAALASGLGGSSAVRELANSRLSRHLLLLKFLGQQWPTDHRQHLDAAVSTLDETQRRDPDMFAVLLSDPLVGAWLARTTRRLRHRRPASDPIVGDLFHLGAVAAAGAIRLGINCQVTGYVRDRRLNLPGLGDAVIPDAADGPVTITVVGGQAKIQGLFGTATIPACDDGWHESHRLTARRGEFSCTVRVEDGSPYRDGYHAPPAERLSPDEIQRWQELFAGAWDLICRCVPQRAPELAVGLRALVPLVDDGGSSARSGTARDSVGAMGLTLPRSAADFVVTVVHEFQHSKLSAVLDLLPLYVSGGTERHFAPWRTDARPTSGLIQGVYAFLGVADAWHGLRTVPELREHATRQLATVREQVQVGLTQLEGSIELTAAGRAFTKGMRTALDPLLSEPVPDQAVRQAAATLVERRSAWLLRHPEPSAGP